MTLSLYYISLREQCWAVMDYHMSVGKNILPKMLYINQSKSFFLERQFIGGFPAQYPSLSNEFLACSS